MASADPSAPIEPAVPAPAPAAAPPPEAPRAFARLRADLLSPEPLLDARASRVVLAVLLALKLATTAFNAAVFDGEVYDQPHHAWRAKSGGLTVSKMAYNPPLYYLPALAAKAAWAGKPAGLGTFLLKVLRGTNVLWLGAFYLAWIVALFPRLLPDRRAAFLASLLLLALPGYQKLAAMVHPDVALAALAAVALAAWLRARDRAGTERDLAPLLVAAAATGAVGLTRPFAIVPVGVLWAATLLLAARGRGLLGRAFLGRAAAITATVAVIAGSWHVYRAVAAKTVLDAYNDEYIAKYEPYREGFRFAPYYLSFHLGALLETPNRKINDGDDRPAWWENRYANSFFTTAYSEMWGDHWLYFSGKRNVEGKLWPKRILLALALVPSLLLLVRLGAGILEAARRVRRERLGADREAVLLALLGGGVLLYLWWQTGPGLLPGKHSTIKFIYNAHLVPLGIALAFLPPLGARRFNAWVVCLGLLFVLALPIAAYWPRA